MSLSGHAVKPAALIYGLNPKRSEADAFSKNPYQKYQPPTKLSMDSGRGAQIPGDTAVRNASASAKEIARA